MKLSVIPSRIIDIIFSIIFLTIFTIPMLFVALAIKIQDGGCVFADIPKRVGKNGKQFFMYKFRSMRTHAHEEIQNKKEYKELREQWVEQEKLGISNDPRITNIGKIIRRIDFDETPQFINVLKGDMSIVGPRPFNQDQIEKYTKGDKEMKMAYEVIKSVKPGITGTWQINGRNRNTIKQRFLIDKKYVEEKNIFLDLYIMFLTPIEIIKHSIFGDK